MGPEASRIFLEFGGSQESDYVAFFTVRKFFTSKFAIYDNNEYSVNL